MSVLAEIVVGRTQQRLRPSDVFPVADGDLSVPTVVGASEAVLERDGAQVLPVDVYAEAAPETQMDVSDYRGLVAWAAVHLNEISLLKTSLRTLPSDFTSFSSSWNRVRVSSLVLSQGS